MFIGRNSEIKRLNQLYSANGFEFAILYGRRRTGKTALMKEFSKDKELIFFSAMETSAGDNLQKMYMAIKEHQFLSAIDINAEKSYQAAFNALAEIACAHRIVMVIDDYQFLEASFKGISRLIADLCDGLFRETRLMLILCISSMTFAENTVFSQGGELFEKPSETIYVEPFDFFETKGFLKYLSPYDTAVAYGITGGVPLYLEKININLSIVENIRRTFLTPTSYIFGEPEAVLRREARDLAFYNAILISIANGHIKLSQIAKNTGLQTSACTAYLNNLSTMGIVRRNTPVGEENSRKTFYTIEDGLFRFWYTVIPPCISLIERGDQGLALDRAMELLPRYMKQAFVDICIQWLWKENSVGRLPTGFISKLGQNGGISGSASQKINEIDALKQWLLREKAIKNLPLEKSNIGSWWGGGGSAHKSAGEIDIMAHSNDGSAIFAMCDWSESLTEAALLEKLIERSDGFAYLSKYLFLFSKTGYTSDCAELAKNHGGINLVTYEKIWNSHYY